MRSVLPYPLLAASMTVMWLLLAGFTRGQLVIAVVVSVAATHGLRSLGVSSPKIRRWSAIPELLVVAISDIIASNAAVVRILLFGGRPDRRAGFVRMNLALRDPVGLAILSVVITSTPGTAWIDYNASRGELLIHVFDLREEDNWPEFIANRYERLLMEIFE